MAKFQDRRRGPDILVKWVKWASLISWLIVSIVLFIIDRARPPVETFFERVLNIKLRTTWDEDLLKYSFYLLIALFIFCAISLIFNAILSLIGIIGYILLFL